MSARATTKLTTDRTSMLDTSAGAGNANAIGSRDMMRG
jgi:hypothetical protein